MTIDSKIEECIQLCLTKGMEDKRKIYDFVVERLEVPRPSVRRVANTLYLKYVKYTKALAKLNGANNLPNRRKA